MGGLRSHALQLAATIFFLSSLCGITACGGNTPHGTSPFPAKVTLSPGGQSSVQLGNTFAFSASAQNGAGNNVSVPIVYQSSDTSILNLTPGGIACAGVWDAGFTNCLPGGIGVVQVTASALGTSSSPTYVFVHPAIDSIVVNGILPNNVPIQEPCLSQGQFMTVQAQAFSQGVDITASVGPFTWTANNSAVVKLTPINNTNFNFPTNQATATAVIPGITQIYATASGVSSTSFSQPAPGTNLHFFETCPIQNITLEVGAAGSEQTSFAVSKGASQTVVATITDVMGNSSLPNPNNAIVLSKIPLTWSSTQPAVIAPGTGCQQSCSLTTASPGSASISASCSPPTCNVGFPLAPAGSIVPVPVYASPLPILPTSPPTCGHPNQPPCPATISGLVSGTPGSTSIVASSQGCSLVAPVYCSVGVYDFASGRTPTGGANPLPAAPTSLQFDLTGDKIYMGSNYGAQVINPANFGTANSAFSPIGTVTGDVLALSPNGSLAIFSDAVHTPNQVFVVNEASATTPVITALNINQATAAAFSPDNLKAFIFGRDTNNNPNLYIYSPLQALQTIPLAANTLVSSIAFSTNGAFAYLVEPSLGGGGPALTAYNTCNNQVAVNQVPLTAPPLSFQVLPDGIHLIAFETNGSVDYITATITGIPAATLANPSLVLCPMTVAHTVQNLNLNIGNIHPINFFLSPDSTLLYVVANDVNSIIVYDFATKSVTGGIQLVSTAGGINPTPVSAQMTADGSTIVVAASDGYVHQITTQNGGSDFVQNQFANLPNFQNPFCTFTPASGPCQLNLLLVKP
jgi:hypothetical protein